MKTEFELDILNNPNITKRATANIIGTSPKFRPYLKVTVSETDTNQELFGIYVQDKDLERFAVNILKSLKSDKLKSDKRRSS